MCSGACIVNCSVYPHDDVPLRADNWSVISREHLYGQYLIGKRQTKFRQLQGGHRRGAESLDYGCWKLFRSCAAHKQSSIRIDPHILQDHTGTDVKCVGDDSNVLSEVTR